MVPSRWFSNSPSTLLVRAIRAYRKLDLSGPRRERPARACPKRAIQLNPTQLARLVACYQAGATVYELAAKFGISRRTVSLHLRRQGIRMRLQPPASGQIDEIVQLYAQGLSMAAVGSAVGINATTVLRYLRERGVQTRDSQGR